MFRKFKELIALLKKLNEIDELKHELNDTKNQLSIITDKINVLCEVTKKNQEKLYRFDWEPNQNIKQRMQDIATRDTAQFILDEMNGGDVVPLNVPLDILDLGLHNVKKCGEGMYLEFGVYTGTTINYIAKKIDETVYGFDSFKGLPENWRSGFGKGTFGIDRLPDVEKNVELVSGMFDDTLPEFLEEHKNNVAFIHVDSDLYSSAKTIFTYLKDRIVSGTVIVFDEYFNYPGWRDGEYKAFKEFIEKTGLRFRYLAYVEISEQVAVEII